MKKTCVLFFALLISLQIHAQSVVTEADSLLLNSAYDQVIGLADKYNGKDERVHFMLLSRKAEALTRLGKITESESLLKELMTKEVSSTFLSGITKTAYGQLYINQGRFDRAEEIIKSAINDFTQAGEEKSLEAAQAISQLGLLYKYLGKPAQAEEQLRMALALRQALVSDKSELMAATFNDLGLVYADIDSDRALDFYDKALDIYKQLHGDNHPKIAIANANIGFVYRNLKLYGDAISNFETALEIWNKVYTQAHQTKAFNLLNLGLTYREMNNVTAARGYFDRALKMYRDSYGDKHPDIANVLNRLGILELESGKYTAAIDFFQQAIVANTTDFRPTSVSVNPAKTSYYNGTTLLTSMVYKAEAFEARYFEKTLKFSDLDIALKTLQRCDSLIDELRQRSTNESDKLELGAISAKAYADGVRIAAGAAVAALHKNAYRQLAFYFAEKSKSAVLLEAISESDAKSFAGIPTPLLEEEKNIKAAIALTSQKLAQKPLPDEERYLRDALFTLNRSYEQFVVRLEKEFPSYFDLKYNAASPAIAELQKRLDQSTAMLSYFIDESRSRLYIFVVTVSSFEIVEHSLPTDFDKFITGFRNGIYYSVSKPFEDAGRKLRSLLIPRLPSRISQLLILPTGRLGIVPFEALPLSSEGSFDQTKYLIDRYAVNYEFSAGLLLQKSKERDDKLTNIFLCAPVSFPGSPLNELPGSETEVTEIAQLFSSTNRSSKLLVGEKASEAEIKALPLKDFSLIHFATHGIVDEQSPELSRIFLQSTNESEDGNLFSGEIYNLEMNASLVTLSACQTGLGKISKGEGVIGLSRALVYAGAKNIMVSFWSVADESTSQLMKAFYRHLITVATAPNYASSLRQAKLELRKNNAYSAPYYWAPFILIGH